MIHAVVADDEALARMKLRQLLAEERDVEVVGEAANAQETFELVQATSPQLVFLDIHMPGMDGLELLSEVTSWLLRTKICKSP